MWFNFLSNFTLRYFANIILARRVFYIIFILLFTSTPLANAEEDVYVIEIKLENHLFIPEEVHVPKNTKIKLIINNLDPTIEEFDSPSLKREKILRSKSKTNIVLAPLSVGRYDFVGEFNQETAKGVVIVE
jgi:hypothetical protein